MRRRFAQSPGTVEGHAVPDPIASSRELKVSPFTSDTTPRHDVIIVDAGAGADVSRGRAARR